MLLLLATLPSSRALHAQAPEPAAAAVTAGDVVAVGAGTVVALVPRVLGIGSRTADCAPCDRSDLPGFDRWALREPAPAWGRASDVLLVGLLAFGVVSTATRDGGGPYATSLVEAGVWTTAATEWIKAGVSRHRPVMYTDRAVAVRHDRNNLRSFPSGHTSLAFAAATAYWLARRDLDGSPGAAGWAAVGAAAGVGTFRVLAGRHFLSDVVAGAVLGVAGGAAVHALKF